MRECGFDEVEIDAVGNVVGVYHGARRRTRKTAADRQPLRHRAQRRQVRRPPRHPRADGVRARAAARRPAPAVRARGRRLRRGGRPALQGDLPRLGRARRPVRSAAGSTRSMPTASRCATRCAMPGCRRRRARSRSSSASPRDYLGFVEVHIEQGPVLNELDLPLGVVTSINGGVRYVGEVRRHGEPRRHDADGPPARRRRRRRRAGRSTSRSARAKRAEPGRHDGHARGAERIDQRRPGPLQVQRSTSARRPTRCATPASATSSRELRAICERRGLRSRSRRRCAPPQRRSAPAWQTRWERAVDALGLPVHRMPSGAGHDAMKLHEVMPQAMLFVRGENAGISHNPLESITNDDIELAVEAFQQLLDDLPRKRAGMSARMTTTTRARRLDRRALRRRGALPAGAGARADRHAAGRQRAARRSDGDAARRLRLRRSSATRCPTTSCARTACSRSPT